MSQSNNQFLSSPRTVTVIPCPFSGGQPKKGVDFGPSQLVKDGLNDDMEGLGYKVNFLGHDIFDMTAVENDEPIGRLLNPRVVSRVCRELADKVEESASHGHLSLTLGGDHSLAMGTISGTFRKYPDACVVWVDAHADINTPLTTPSGNMHGCPVSFLLGLQGTEIPEFSWIKPVLDAKRITYIGLRDLDEGERKIIKDSGISAYTMHHVDKYGIGKVVEMALNDVDPNGNRPIHLSFDVDALDPSVAPATGTAVRGGLTFREGHFICEEIAKRSLVGVDIMEVNPSLGNSEAVAQTVSVARSLTRSALGEVLL